MIGAVIVAAGKGVRFGKDKLTLPLGALTVIEAAALPFINHCEIDEIIIAVDADKKQSYRDIFEKYQAVKTIKFVIGGATRGESVKAALKAFYGDYVLIHDGARPNITAALIGRVIAKMREKGACVPVVLLKESIRSKDGALLREQFSTTQTPQGFDAEKLRLAYDKASEVYSDDAAVYEAMFGIVSTIEGDTDNIKITYPSDYYGLNGKDILVGVGFDMHRLQKGRKLILGGAEIPFEKGLAGHSDADALIHALMDAILSAVGEGDIGKLFPDTDIKFKDISSMLLLGNVQDIIVKKGYSINNIAATIIAEAPRLASYIPKMCENIGRILGIDSGRIGIAATSAEGLGIVGEGKGIAAYCMVSLIKN